MHNTNKSASKKGEIYCKHGTITNTCTTECSGYTALKGGE